MSTNDTNGSREPVQEKPEVPDAVDGAGVTDVTQVTQGSELQRPTPSKRPLRAEQVLALVQDIDLFRSQDSQGYATVAVNHHKETWALGSDGFRDWLQQRVWKKLNHLALSDVLSTVCDQLEARARFSRKSEVVFTRVGSLDGRVYLDLLDDNWRVVEVDRNGWRVIEDSPVKFQRGRGMLPLPMPIKGGAIEELRPFVNVEDDEDFRLLVIALLGSLHPSGPYPILVLCGEPGSPLCQRP